MIKLNHKQIEDLHFLSQHEGGASVQIETVWYASGSRTYAYIGKASWLVPKKGALRRLKNDF